MVAQQSNDPHEVESGVPRVDDHSQPLAMAIVGAEDRRVATLSRDGTRDDNGRPEVLGNARDKKIQQQNQQQHASPKKEPSVSVIPNMDNSSQSPLLVAQAENKEEYGEEREREESRAKY